MCHSFCLFADIIGMLSLYSSVRDYNISQLFVKTFFVTDNIMLKVVCNFKVSFHTNIHI